MQDIRTVVDRWLELWNTGDTAIADQILALGYVFHSPLFSEQVCGADLYKQRVTTIRAAFPDIRFTAEDEIAQGEKVAVRWTARGTHTGHYRGAAPTGRQITDSGISILHIRDGKIVEEWEEIDSLGLLQQLGLVSIREG